MAISMLKIRRPLGRLIFNMGIAIPGKTVFLIETAPWAHAIKAVVISGPTFIKFENFVIIDLNNMGLDTSNVS